MTAFIPGGKQARKILDQLGIKERAHATARSRLAGAVPWACHSKDLTRGS